MEDLVYLYYGKDEFLVQMKLDEKVKSFDVDEININKYDLLENTSEDVLEDLRTISFFSNNKIVIVKNLDNVLKDDEYLINEWINYLSKPNDDVILLIVLDELIDQKLPLGKALLNYAFIEEVKVLGKDDYPNYVAKMAKKYNYKIDEDAILELVERTNNDLTMISQELEKLVLFNYDTKHINKESVVLMVNRNLEENIYELTNAVVSRNINKAIEVFYDLMARNEEPIRILNQLANKFRELLHVKLLIDKGYTQDQVSKHFNMAPGKTYYVIKSARQISFSVLEDYIKRLGKLDHEIKSGQADKKLGLEMFLLGV